MSQPRRSARLSPHLSQEHQQPNYLGPAQGHFSQPSSTSTTSYPSPSNDSSNPPPPPPTPAQARLQVYPNFGQTQQQSNTPHLYAPLPSPSVENMSPFFPQTQSQQQPQQQQQQQQQQPLAQQQTSSPAYQGHQQGHHNSISQPHQPNTQNPHGGQLPPNFLAEAAKRAQMACLMRDLGDVSL